MGLFADKQELWVREVEKWCAAMWLFVELTAVGERDSCIDAAEHA